MSKLKLAVKAVSGTHFLQKSCDWLFKG